MIASLGSPSEKFQAPKHRQKPKEIPLDTSTLLSGKGYSCSPTSHFHPQNRHLRIPRYSTSKSHQRTTSKPYVYVNAPLNTQIPNSLRKPSRIALTLRQDILINPTHLFQDIPARSPIFSTQLKASLHIMVEKL